MTKANKLIVSKKEMEKAYNSVLESKKLPEIVNGIVIPKFSNLHHFIQEALKNIPDLVIIEKHPHE